MITSISSLIPDEGLSTCTKRKKKDDCQNNGHHDESITLVRLTLVEETTFENWHP